MDLGDDPAGEIDQHVFRDGNGSTYIVWKTDDNSLGKKLTRLWAQEIVIDEASGTVAQVGGRVDLAHAARAAAQDVDGVLRREARAAHRAALELDLVLVAAGPPPRLLRPLVAGRQRGGEELRDAAARL